MKNIWPYALGTWNGICLGIIAGLAIAQSRPALASPPFSLLWMGMLVFVAGLPNSIIAIAAGVKRYGSASKRKIEDHVLP